MEKVHAFGELMENIPLRAEVFRIVNDKVRNQKMIDIARDFVQSGFSNAGTIQDNLPEMSNQQLQQLT